MLSAHRNIDEGPCPDCGKLRYRSRKRAKAAARSRSYQGINAYQCGDFWHFGHLPKWISDGTVERTYLDRDDTA